MIIQKILNNNVVIVEMNGEETVVMGKGLAFGKKVGQSFDGQLIEKVFKLQADDRHRFVSLVSELNPEILQVSSKIIERANLIYSKPLAESIYIALTDHINYAIIRAEENVFINNALLYEIKQLYRKEFEVGLYGIRLIKETLGVALTEDEAGFIALHIVNAGLNEEMSNIYEITKTTQDIVNIVRYHFNLHLKEDELSYSRFLTHLKFFCQRILNGEVLIEISDETLLSSLKTKYRDSYACVLKINDYIVNRFDHALSSDEIMYLILHIARLLKSEKNHESVDK